MAASSKTRQARSRKARADAGARQITVTLNPEAAAALQGVRRTGETITATIIRVLVSSATPGTSERATLIAELQEAANNIIVPTNMTETRAEYWKHGAATMVRAMNSVLSSSRR